MTISDYYSELMKQSYNDSLGINYTPVAIMSFLRENNYIIKTQPVINLCKYIYRFYADNPHFAKKNSNIIVSNISHYYVKDLKEYSIEQLRIWIKNGNSVLQCNGESIYTNPEMQLSISDITMLNKVVESLCIRNFGFAINYVSTIESTIKNVNPNTMSFQQYCSIVNSTSFAKRAFESINYCPCCEETDVKELQAIHLDLSKDYDNPDNSIIFCKSHAQLYYDNMFCFNPFGKIIIKKAHPLLDKRMHLSIEYVKDKKIYLTNDELL